MNSTARRPVLAALVTAVLGLFATAPAEASTACTKFASPTGADTATGSESSPFRSAQKLADSLSAGQTGCLREGTYEGAVKITEGGTSEAARVTLRNAPGERAEVAGRLWVAQGADFVTVENLHLNGRNESIMPSPTVNAEDTVFRNNDVTNGHTAICFNLGNSSYGRAVRTVIESNRIHNCGVLPAANHDHAIYITRADEVQVRNNWIYDNADRGIQLYPDAQRTTITGNVIDGNGQGVIFSGLGGSSSNDTVVEGNTITNSKLRHNVESYYPADGTQPGTGNVVRRNCIKGGARDAGNGGIASPQVGFQVQDNHLVNPGYANPAAKDFRVDPAGACGRLMPAPAAIPGPDSPAWAPAPASATAPASASAPKPTRTTAPKRRGRGSLSVRASVTSVASRVARRRGGALRLVVRGRATHAAPGAAVRVVTRTNRGWRAVGTARLRADGTFRLVRSVRGRHARLVRALLTGGQAATARAR